MTIYAVDETAPDPPAFSVALSNFHEAPLASLALSIDPTTHTHKAEGKAKLVYAKDGMLFVVDLRKTASHVPVQVSPATNVCSVTGTGDQLSAAGDDFILTVRLGQGANCTTTTEANVHFLPDGTSITVSDFPAGSEPVTTLFDPQTLGFVAYLVKEPASGGGFQLALFDANRSRLAGVGALHASVIKLILPLIPQLAIGAVYLNVDGGLRRVTYEATPAPHAALSDPLVAFAGAPDQVRVNTVFEQDGAFYFEQNERQDVYRVPGDGPVQLVTTLPSIYFLIGAIGDKLIVQASGTTAQSFGVLPKAGGNITALPLAANVPAGATTLPSFLTDQRILYTLDNAGHRQIRSLAVDGSNDNLVLDDPRTKLSDVETFESLNTQITTGAIYCDNTGLDSQVCADGMLRQLDFASSSLIALGSLGVQPSGTSRSVRMGLGGTSDLVLESIPATVEVNTTTATDMYIFTPGQASSLKRISHNAP